MRATFIKALMEIAELDSRVILLTGDLGYMVMEPFFEKFPERFYNAGVAEQNMVGVATGLAEAGFIPFVYSIAPFASLRPYEFIRNGPVHQQLQVRVVGVGGGFEYGHNGASHYGLEDIAVMRAHPELTVIAPADAAQARTAIFASWDLPGAVYYRLGKDDRTVAPGLDGRFELGKVQRMREGTDVAIVALGAMAVSAMEAAGLLAEEGISAAVSVVASVNPAPADDLAQLLRSHNLVVTIEAHYAQGGLGSLVCELVAERNLGCKVIRCGVTRGPDGLTGSQTFMEDHYDISASKVAAKVKATLGAGFAATRV